MPERYKYLGKIELGFVHTVREEISQYGLCFEEEFPQYREIESTDEIKSVRGVAADLQAIDWSFTDDNTEFLTHDLHPYPAKFIPQIPGHCISRLSLRGELVLDPFGGSGTTALEAVRMGRRALSIDANAVGTLVGKAKTYNIDRAVAIDLHGIRTALTTRRGNLPNPERLCEENRQYIPEIPNIDKWFPLTSRGELAFIRSRIASMENDKARDIALLSLSRIILSVSFQDSETRYSSKPRNIPQGETLNRFLAALDQIVRNIAKTQPILRYGVCAFITADARHLMNSVCKPDSVDLIVTSPPYGNANDYHLYHRFRLLWLGYDPVQLAKIEIGSHLRHQKEDSGFDSYLAEMEQCLSGMYGALRPGRYAVIVVGDAIYKGKLYPGAVSLSNISEKLGFETVSIIERKLHSTKRSFVAAGRRAITEKLLVIRKPATKVAVWFQAPPYKLWPYEANLRNREIEVVLGTKASAKNGEPFALNLDPLSLTKSRKLVFTHGIGLSAQDTEPTWQAIIENGFVLQTAARKDPKYVTHGIHPYKGKFYPQLAKGLMNLCNLSQNAVLFDPFCGSGTTLLEGYLNGHQTFGCDMHPLAAKIAKAKIGILEIDPDIVNEAIGTLVNRIEQIQKLPNDEEQFNVECLDEIRRWFPLPVMHKLNWLLRLIRSISEGLIRDFFEVVLSSIIRKVSQQDPNDLRIRKRKKTIQDADVFMLYLDALDTQYERIERFWAVRGYAPSKFRPSRIVKGDSRQWTTFNLLGLNEESVDLILTSPPYATALPYIDTDRLSLLILFGMDSSRRRPVEHNLVGSREIVTTERRQMEESLVTEKIKLPANLRTYLKDLHHRVSKANVGFRRKNMPALLLRFFSDMDTILQNCYRALRPEGEAMIVIGDNRMAIDGDYERIATAAFIQDIALLRGFSLIERIDISVTTENLVHIKNAITENVVLRLKRPSIKKHSQV
jgi:DNA modification methylase